MNAREVTEFFLKQCQRHGRPGRCFEGWTADKVFNYVLVNLVHGNVFVARRKGGAASGVSDTGDRATGQSPYQIALAAIAWLDDAATIIAKAERGLPQFDWKGFPTDGDSILIADVAGDRKLMPQILTLAMERWAGVPQKRLFTYRRGVSDTGGGSATGSGSTTGLRLVELSWKTVFRFSRSTIGRTLSSRGATLESSQTRSVWWSVSRNLCPEGTKELPPSFQDGMCMVELPDTPCLATFRLCLQHEQNRSYPASPDRISTVQCT